jgi:anti-anti-sigma regulatory factor
MSAGDGLDERALVTHVRGCVVVAVRADLDAERLAAFRHAVLGAVRARGSRAVVFDLSALALMDLDDFEALRRTIAMVQVLGARAVLVGLRPALVGALVELGADLGGIVGELTLEAGLERALRES